MKLLREIGYLWLLLLLLSCAGEKADAKAAEGVLVQSEAKMQEQSSPKGAVPVAPGATDSLPDAPPAIELSANWQDYYHPKYLQGRFAATEHPAIVPVPKGLTDGDGTYHMHREALAAFQEMQAAAAEEGIRLFIVSAFRNFDRQKSIWEAKWNGQRLLEGKEAAPAAYPDPAQRALAILRYSSMPGTSRHHWGTDIDLNRLNNEYFEAGEGKKIYDWLTAHAADYGFCQPYTPLGAERPHGYQEERWHWSYMPIAQKLTQFAAQRLQYDMIQGFDGAAVAQKIEVIERYVLGVNAACK